MYRHSTGERRKTETERGRRVWKIDVNRSDACKEIYSDYDGQKKKTRKRNEEKVGRKY